MGAGANAGGFAAGFGKGLSNALLRNRERSDQKTRDEQSRKDRLFQSLLPTMLENVEDPADLEPFLAQQFPEQFGTPGKGAGKKGQSPFDNIKRFIGPLIGMRGGGGGQPQSPAQSVTEGTITGGQPRATALPSSAQPAGVTGGTLDFLQGTQQPGQTLTPTTRDITDPSEAARIIGTPVGGSTATSSTAGIGAPSSPTGAPGRRTLMGVPIMSAEQKAVALVKRAQTILPALQMADPTATLEDAFSILRTGTMTRDQRTSGTSAASLFDEQLRRKTAELKRPMTSEEVLAERKNWEAANDSTSTRSLGIYAERAARDLGFPSAEAAAAAGKMPEVNKKANELAAGQAGATTAARVTEQGKAPLTTNQKFQAITDLQTAWRKAEAPAREMDRQLKLMKTGLDRFRKGDKIGGSQAVLVTFQKILDPESVVRESEYARTPQGLALGSRLEGFLQRLQEGGAGVPDAELSMMVDTAQQFLDGMAGWNDLERERIGSTAKDFGLDPARVFGVAAATGKGGGGGAGGTGTTPAPAKPGDASGPVWKDGKLYVNGVPIN